jgi:hypothetical protein
MVPDVVFQKFAHQTVAFKARKTLSSCPMSFLRPSYHIQVFARRVWHVPLDYPRGVWYQTYQPGILEFAIREPETPGCRRSPELGNGEA